MEDDNFGFIDSGAKGGITPTEFVITPIEWLDDDNGL